MERREKIPAEQALALYLYNPRIVRLRIGFENTSDLQSTAVFEYAGDFDRAIRTDKKLSDCYDRAMTAIHGEKK